MDEPCLFDRRWCHGFSSRQIAPRSRVFPDSAATVIAPLPRRARGRSPVRSFTRPAVTRASRVIRGRPPSAGQYSPANRVTQGRRTRRTRFRRRPPQPRSSLRAATCGAARHGRRLVDGQRVVQDHAVALARLGGRVEPRRLRRRAPARSSDRAGRRSRRRPACRRRCSRRPRSASPAPWPGQLSTTSGAAAFHFSSLPTVPGAPPPEAPGRVLVPVRLVDDVAWREEALHLDDAEPAAMAPGARRHVVSKLVAVADQRQVHAEILDSGLLRVLRINSSIESGPSDAGRPP